MKKFLLFAFAFVIYLSADAQQYEEFNLGILPTGWDLATGMQVSPYNNPDNSCSADYGLETPGVGGNNPARILTSINTYSSTYNAGKIDVGFTIYIFDANLKCSSMKALPCATYVTVYLVDPSVTTATVPSNPALILYTSQVQLVAGNAVNVLNLTPSFANGTRYRVLYDFSVAGTCNQNGTKYIIDKFLVPGTNGTLPVTLTSFDAAQKSGKVVLNWATILELNNDGFDVERKIGNGQYQKIGFVDSKAPGGNGAAYSYTFEDAASLPNGPVYYRIRQVDFDGHSVYSEIRSIRIGNGTLTLMVYPNPSRGTTNVAIPSGIGSVDVSVDDVTGKSVQRFSNLNTSSLQLSNLKAGMYFIRVKVNSTGETITERLAVQ